MIKIKISSLNAGRGVVEYNTRNTECVARVHLCGISITVVLAVWRNKDNLERTESTNPVTGPKGDWSTTEERTV